MFIKVANLSPKTISAQLRRLFASFGEVDAADIECDKLNGRPKGTAIIEMPFEKQALLAIESLDRSIVDGKIIRVLRNESTGTW